MAKNKFLTSRLTFDLSAKVAHAGVKTICLNIVFSETIWLDELKFDMKAS